jgi:hypothetical protein
MRNGVRAGFVPQVYVPIRTPPYKIISILSGSEYQALREHCNGNSVFNKPVIARI